MVSKKERSFIRIQSDLNLMEDITERLFKTSIVNQTDKEMYMEFTRYLALNQEVLSRIVEKLKER